jgi:hypothetical protein
VPVGSSPAVTGTTGVTTSSPSAGVTRGGGGAAIGGQAPESVATQNAPVQTAGVAGPSLQDMIRRNFMVAMMNQGKVN